MQRHVNDEFVKRSKREGYRSRATYKLLEIQEKDHPLQTGQVVVDLGAAPGGWSQLAAELVGPKGDVIAFDILPMDPMAGVTVIQGDFREEEALRELEGVAGRAPGRPCYFRHGPQCQRCGRGRPAEIDVPVRNGAGFVQADI